MNFEKDIKEQTMDLKKTDETQIMEFNSYISKLELEKQDLEKKLEETNDHFKQAQNIPEDYYQYIEEIKASITGLKNIIEVFKEKVKQLMEDRKIFAKIQMEIQKYFLRMQYITQDIISRFKPPQVKNIIDQLNHVLVFPGVETYFPPVETELSDIPLPVETELSDIPLQTNYPHIPLPVETELSDIPIKNAIDVLNISNKIQVSRDNSIKNMLKTVKEVDNIFDIEKVSQEATKLESPYINLEDIILPEETEPENIPIKVLKTSESKTKRQVIAVNSNKIGLLFSIISSLVKGNNKYHNLINNIISMLSKTGKDALNILIFKKYKIILTDKNLKPNYNQLILSPNTFSDIIDSFNKISKSKSLYSDILDEMFDEISEKNKEIGDFFENLVLTNREIKYELN
jgi:hypothetical protein